MSGTTAASRKCRVSPLFLPAPGNGLPVRLSEVGECEVQSQELTPQARAPRRTAADRAAVQNAGRVKEWIYAGRARRDSNL